MSSLKIKTKQEFFLSELINKQTIMDDRKKLDEQRKRAVRYFIENYSREQRYLIILSRDMEKYISAFTADNFSSQEKREGLRWDFYADFQLLRERMREYGWNAKFLAENGIDFRAAKKLLFKIFSKEELASV